MKLDPGRLIALSKDRATRKATIFGLNEQYADLRVKLSDIERRRSAQNLKVEWGDPRGRQGYAGHDDELAKEASSVRAEMADLQQRIQTEAEEAGEVGRLFTSCMSFAVTNGLLIPKELAMDAAIVSGNVHPGATA